MLFLVIIIIAFVSVLMAFWSLKKQNKIDELHKAKKELKRGRVVFQRK